MKLYKENNHYSYIALGLSIASLLLWLIPVAGLIISIACLFFVHLGLDTNNRTPAFFALVMGLMGLVLTVIRILLVLFLT